jgi:hypothetical protein
MTLSTGLVGCETAVVTVVRQARVEVATVVMLMMMKLTFEDPLRN